MCRSLGRTRRTRASTRPATELPFAGHPTVGASWWLRDRGIPIHTLQVPAGIVQVTYEDDLTAVSARSEWAPEFAIYDLESTDELFAADPEDYPDDIQNYLWTWTDRERGAIRSRMFAANLGVPEDEATGAAAVRITDYLSRDLTIVQGKGSVIHTQWSPEGWVRIAGRVVERRHEADRLTTADGSALCGQPRGLRAALRSPARSLRPTRTTGRPRRTADRPPRRVRAVAPGSPARLHGWAPRVSPWPARRPPPAGRADSARRRRPVAPGRPAAHRG